MTDFAKPIIIGLIGVFLAVVVRQERKEIAIGISLATGIIILILCLEPIVGVVEFLRNLCEKTGIDFVFFEIILKIIGVSYITQLASSTAEDSGQNTIALKIDFAGKIAIIVLALPILQEIVDMLMELI